MRACALIFIYSVLTAWLAAGPYSEGGNDPLNPYDAPVPLMQGPDGDGVVFGGASANWLNPAIAGWATWVASYDPIPEVNALFADPGKALGPATGDAFDVVSLGELDEDQIAAGLEPGSVTLGFDTPIRNRPGADFTVFGNAFVADGSAGVEGDLFAELAYVEVSSDNEHFLRFASHSLTSEPVLFWGAAVDPSNVFGLAGKHVNAGGYSWGTPFDLSSLHAEPMVLDGKVDLNAIQYVRLIDIAGNGSFSDSWGNAIYDPWPTEESAGFDLAAIGVISTELTYDVWVDLQNIGEEPLGPLDDFDGDGMVNLIEYAFASSPQSVASRFVPEGLMVDGRVAIVFNFDTRQTDLVVTVESSGDLVNWTPLARSIGGNGFEATGARQPVITDQSASREASVQVIRRVTVRDDAAVAETPRFLRVRVALEQGG